MKKALTWLHISDLHARQNTGWDSVRILKTLSQDLRHMEDEHGLTPDLIFFTGDAAFGKVGNEGMAGQYALAHEFFQGVRKAFRVEVPIERFFIVPGNHDVNRKKVGSAITSWLDSQSDPVVISKMMATKNDEWKLCAKRQKDYSVFLREQGYPHSLTDSDRVVFNSTIEINGLRIGVAGFNSSWSCGSKEKEQGWLWIGEIWQMNHFFDALQNADIRIALGHHPWNWYRSPEGPNFALGLKRDFKFFLHGHEHMSFVDELDSGLITISAGACYERSDKKTGYNFVRIFIEDGGGEVWLRTFEPKGGSWIAENIANHTDDHGMWTLKCPHWSKKRPNTPISSPVLASTETGSLLDLVTTDLQRALESGQKAVAATSVLSGQNASLPNKGEPPIQASDPSRASISADVVYENNTTGALASEFDDSTESRVQAEIDEAAAPITELRPQIALDRLNRLELKNANTLSKRARFRLAANKGHAFRIMNELKQAADQYRMALAEDPGNPEAQYLDALADSLVDDYESSRRKAFLLFSNSRVAIRARALWLNTIPPGSFQDAESAVPENERADKEIAAALSQLATRHFELRSALDYARSAHDLDPESPFMCELLAAALLNVELSHRTRYRGAKHIDFASVEYARDLLKKAIATFSNFANPFEIARHRTLLSTAYRLLGQQEQAMLEIRIASQAAPEDVEVAYNYAALLDESDQRSEAIERLSAWEKKPHPIKLDLLLATLLAVRRAPTDLTRAVSVLTARRHDVESEFPPTVRAEWANALVQLNIELNDHIAARNALDSIPKDWLAPEHRHVLDAEIYRVAGDETSAKHAAAEAYVAAKNSADSRSVARAALLLEQIGEYANALELWRKLAEPPAIGLESEHMLHCAVRSGQSDIVIDYCRRLREIGVYDVRYTQIELGALERTSPEETLRTLQQLVNAPYSEEFRKELRTHLSCLALMLAKPDLAVKDSSLLPSVDSVKSARAGRAVVEVLCASNHLEAVKYAYGLFRRFPDEFDSYLSVLRSSVLSQIPSKPWEEPTEVCAGTAVCFRESGSDQIQWTIIEDLPDPKPSLEERSPDDPIANALFNHKRGDVVVVRTEPTKRAVTVVEIINKFTYRIQWCMREMEIRFPGETPVFKMQMGSPNATEPDFKELFEQLDRRAKRIESIEQWYAANPVSVFMFGRQIGKTVFEVVNEIANTNGLPLRSCRGTFEEYDRAAKVMEHTNGLVLDASALATLYCLNADLQKTREQLGRVSKSLSVAEATVTELRQLLDERIRSTSPASIGKSQGKVYIAEVDAASVARERERLKIFVEMVTRDFVVIPDSPGALLGLQSRERLLEIFGRSSVATLMIASQNGIALWTDDQTVGEIASSELGLSRVWTQPVFTWLASKGRIDQAVENEVAIRLVQMNYRHTGINSNVLMTAAEKSKWDPDAEPFAKVLACLGDRNSEEGGVYLLAALLLRDAWLKPILVQLKERISQRILQLLGSLKNGQNNLARLYQELDGLFGLNVIGAEHVRQIIHGAAVARENKIIIP